MTNVIICCSWLSLYCAFILVIYLLFCKQSEANKHISIQYLRHYSLVDVYGVEQGRMESGYGLGAPVLGPVIERLLISDERIRRLIMTSSKN